MTHRIPATDRSHGGPGSSHENADKPGAAPRHRRDSGGRSNSPPVPGAPTNGDRSSSGGSGERDKHLSHDPRFKG